MSVNVQRKAGIIGITVIDTNVVSLIRFPYLPAGVNRGINSVNRTSYIIFAWDIVDFM
jgi:hypothetical protein